MRAASPTICDVLAQPDHERDRPGCRLGEQDVEDGLAVGVHRVDEARVLRLEQVGELARRCARARTSRAVTLVGVLGEHAAGRRSGPAAPATRSRARRRAPRRAAARSSRNWRVSASWSAWTSRHLRRRSRCERLIVAPMPSPASASSPSTTTTSAGSMACRIGIGVGQHPLELEAAGRAEGPPFGVDGARPRGSGRPRRSTAAPRRRPRSTDRRPRSGRASTSMNFSPKSVFGRTVNVEESARDLAGRR